jgi:hypothetical protein
VEVVVDREVIRVAHRGRLTFSLHFSDCAGERFWVSDLYVNEQSLYQSIMTDEEFDRLFGSLPKTVSMSAYLYEKDYRSKAPICVQVLGSNMAGQIVRSDEYTLKD